MKKSILSFLIIALMAMFVFTSCKKDKIDGSKWDLNVTVNLNGTFAVIATSTFTIDGSNFSAAITTSQIGGAAEVHNFNINGTFSGDTYTVTNSTFSITVGSNTEDITITTGIHTVDGSSMSGSGSVSTLPIGATGTYTFTGTKQ
jgi:hypothetical protein